MKQKNDLDSELFTCLHCGDHAKSFLCREADYLGHIILRCVTCDQDYHFPKTSVNRISEWGYRISKGTFIEKMNADGRIISEEPIDPVTTPCVPKGASYAHSLRQCADIADKRQEAYGSPAINFANIQAICKEAFGLEISMKSIAMVMVATKLSRERNAHKEDNLLDAINYIAILNQFCDASIFQDSHTPSTTSPITNEDER